MSFPKIVALDVEWTLVKGWMDIDKLGLGPRASTPPQDNLEIAEGGWQLRDRTNHNVHYWLYSDVPAIFTDILKHGAKIAIVSENKSKALVDRVLWWFNAEDPNTKGRRPLIDIVSYDEVYDKDKTEHMEAIHKSSGVHYSDMILFDDDAAHNIVRVVQGVTFHVSRDQKGLTMSNYKEGIEQWRRSKRIRSPYIDQHLSSYPKRMFIGYAGIDQATIDLLKQGKNRVDLKEAARWGYATYITDNPALAKYFAKWIKDDAFGANAKTSVCAIWVRDKDLFHSVPKVWAPEDGKIMTDIKIKDMHKIGWAQESRDRLVARWGVQSPYILFSRHFKMNGMPLKDGQRWNEMVIYSQVQDALMLTFPMTDEDVDKRIKEGFEDYTKQIKPWKIHVPDDTKADFQKYKENLV